ncbi:hypothetical protein GCM10023084_27780 [Streptomyces lacrimifluminis]|uniref:Uncharacterized protein n=1 Tax=Streptomyces lacrimifluminis TaxID=1500077 RepID=A0A917KTG4_9ACTN|nr:hypothetical protein GCM10012282_24400 [Streptomyces lacrimifluminis]
MRHLVFFEVPGYFIELADDGLAAQTSTELVIPSAERACCRFELFDFTLTESAAPAYPLRDGRCLEPPFERVEQSGAGDGGTGQGARCCAAVHHEVAPGQV